MTKFDKRLDTLEGVGGGFNPRDFQFTCRSVYRDAQGARRDDQTHEIVPDLLRGEFGGEFVFTSGINTNEAL